MGSPYVTTDYKIRELSCGFLKWNFFAEGMKIFKRYENSDRMRGIVERVVGGTAKEESAYEGTPHSRQQSPVDSMRR